MLLPMLYYLADVIAFFNVVVVGKTLDHTYGLIMADTIARWQMLQPLFIYVMADLVTKLADHTCQYFYSGMDY